ncbi:MAG: nickel-dependent lactate racemase [Candidatus Methanomethylophilaceae archaeon]|jgi:nickel-dependent lactate racemase
MIVDIKYGKDGQESVHIPDEKLIGVYHPNEVQSRPAEQEIEAALDSPQGWESIESFLEGGEDVVFIVNDGTRPTPTAQVLDVLSRRIDLRCARFLVATGTHRAPTREEYEYIFGPLYDHLKDRVYSHDCLQDPMVNLGTSKNGTVMEVNRMAVEADRLVIITSVEPHYFAGYTGGRKSFLPGVASYRTIEQNHRLAMRAEAQALALEGNPVHEDMMDALQVVEGKRIFSIQTVLDRHQRIYRAAAGDLHQAFFQAVRWADEVFSVQVPERADVVISVAPYPMDVDLYQSQKALDNGKWALKEGGTIVIVSKCREGVGHAAFLDQLSSCSDPQELMRRLNLEYRLGHHKAAKMAEISTWARIFVVSGLEPSIISKANMRPFPSVDAALRLVWEEDPQARVLVLTDGSITVPKVQ